jgi:hypothetical protein
MSELPVLHAGQRRTVTLDGAAYTIRALTYGEMSALQLAQAARPRPPEAEVTEATAEACRALGREDLAEALAEHEEAADALSAHFADRPPEIDAEGCRRWDAEEAATTRDLRRRLLSLSRKRDLAQSLTAGAEGVGRLRERMMAALHMDVLETVAAGLEAIGDKAGPFALDDIRALPAGHVTALCGDIRALQAVSRDAAKN